MVLTRSGLNLESPAAKPRLQTRVSQTPVGSRYLPSLTRAPEIHEESSHLMAARRLRLVCRRPAGRTEEPPNGTNDVIMDDDDDNPQASELTLDEAERNKFLRDAANLYERTFEELLQSNTQLAQRNKDLAVAETMNKQHLATIKTLRDEASEGKRQLDDIRLQVAAHLDECNNLNNAKDLPIVLQPTFATHYPLSPIDPALEDEGDQGDQLCLLSNTWTGLLDRNRRPSILISDLFVWHIDTSSFVHMNSQTICTCQVEASLVNDKFTRSAFFRPTTNAMMTNWDESILQVQDLVFENAMYQDISSWEQLHAWLECFKCLADSRPGTMRRIRCLYGRTAVDKDALFAASLGVEPL
ncbi:hypothetical protein PV10_04303 [Exophiala mesophila]|uniref:Uncharacterized protein n=1 Tax=Exophiala mesophila TaxID=212818 RepID=A0A0D2A210_EXOME|nr:uncharacterized protein PV10_04303 [Exophiala mesophila]KIV93058.1 hypothetical protein PV10_04303 [Exophiala mesophila]